MFDQVYDNDADDGLMDLGIQLGKLRMSDRVGGLGMWYYLFTLNT